MIGQIYNQLMRSRLGLGQKFEGYGGFNPQPAQPPMQAPPSPTPWMHSLPANNGGIAPPDMGVPGPTPWMHQGNGMGSPMDSSGGMGKSSGIEGGPYGPPHQMPSNPVDTNGMGHGSMDNTQMGRNPWQRY